MGRPSPLGQDDLYLLTQLLSLCDEAYCIFATPSMFKDALDISGMVEA